MKGSLLRKAATEDALWSKAMDAVGPSLPGTPSRPAADTGAEPKYESAGANEVFKTYYAQSEKVIQLI